MKVKIICELQVEKHFDTGTYLKALFMGGSFGVFTKQSTEKMDLTLKEREFELNIIDGNKFKAKLI